MLDRRLSHPWSRRMPRAPHAGSRPTGSGREGRCKEIYRHYAEKRHREHKFRSTRELGKHGWVLRSRCVCACLHARMMPGCCDCACDVGHSKWALPSSAAADVGNAICPARSICAAAADASRATSSRPFAPRWTSTTTGNASISPPAGKSIQEAARCAGHRQRASRA
jgi:hypothetical protein